MTTPNTSALAAHTPGPWYTGIVDGDLFILPRGEGMCVTSFQIRGMGRNASESLANGSLIAAAPDLLEALLNAIYDSGFSPSGPTDFRAAEDGEPQWVCNARAVIAEATKGAR